MPRPARDAPRAASPGWPDLPCDEPVAEYMRVVAINLRDAIGDRSLRSVAAATGVDHRLIGRLLAGEVWVEAATVARLELGLGGRLWPAG